MANDSKSGLVDSIIAAFGMSKEASEKLAIALMVGGHLSRTATASLVEATDRRRLPSERSLSFFNRYVRGSVEIGVCGNVIGHVNFEGMFVPALEQMNAEIDQYYQRILASYQKYGDYREYAAWHSNGYPSENIAVAFEPYLVKLEVRSCVGFIEEEPRNRLAKIVEDVVNGGQRKLDEICAILVPQDAASVETVLSPTM